MQAVLVYDPQNFLQIHDYRKSHMEKAHYDALGSYAVSPLFVNLADCPLLSISSVPSGRYPAQKSSPSFKHCENR